MNRLLATTLLLLVRHTAVAQDPLSGTLTMGFGDVATLKQKAEAGDLKAQVALADTYSTQFHPSLALPWYRKAAEKGDIDGEYKLGKLLLFGASRSLTDQGVQANPVEGVRWTFRAATNFHPYACWNMSKARQQGLGVTTNVVEAYAWLQLFADSKEGSIVGRVELNNLALRLDTTVLRQAQTLANQYKSGNWQPPVFVPEGSTHLKLDGITIGSNTRLAVISGKTLAEGESAKILINSAPLTVKCLKIETDFVKVSIDGETSPRELRLK